MIHWLIIPSRFALIFCLIILAAGCGSDVPFDIVPVSGKITYADGSLIPADNIEVIFSPIDPPREGNMVAPGGRTSVNVEDGTFDQVNSHRIGDGLLKGRHKVSVIANKPGLLAKDYRSSSKTPLEVEITSKNQSLELKVDK